MDELFGGAREAGVGQQHAEHQCDAYRDARPGEQLLHWMSAQAPAVEEQQHGRARRKSWGWRGFSRRERWRARRQAVLQTTVAQRERAIHKGQRLGVVGDEQSRYLAFVAHLEQQPEYLASAP